MRKFILLAVLLLLTSCLPTPTPTLTPVISITDTIQPTATETLTPAYTLTLEPSATLTSTSTPTPFVTRTYTPTIVSTELPPDAKVFYVDCENGSTSNNGLSPDYPYKSLAGKTFYSGSIIKFKGGSTCTGGITLVGSGSETNPIMVKSYGTGIPIFENMSSSNYGRGLILRGDYIIVDGILVRNTVDAGIYIDTASDYVTVQNSEITNTGIGITIGGVGAKVLNNNVHHLKMVRNTSGGDDDYGAVGVLLKTSDAEIAYNSFTYCRAESYDYGWDGGTIEFYGNVSRANIHHNYSAFNQGFIEVGSGSNSSVNENIISYNTTYNNGRPLGLHLSGGFGVVLEGLIFEHNTIVDVNPAPTPTTAILFLGATPTPTTLIMRYNIFYMAHYTKFANGSNFTHDHNIYWWGGRTTGLGFTLGEGELIADPLFLDLEGGNYLLQSNSPALGYGAHLQ